MVTKLNGSSTAPVLTETSSQVPVSLTVNNETYETAVACDLLLIDLLRDELGLTGAKFGCETGQCGACTVLLDGVSVKSCAVLAAQADGHTIVTIEGLAPGNAMTELQNSLRENHAVQCGYCTPGMVLSLRDLLQRTPRPTEEQIRRSIDGNICRCGVYQNVVKAVLSLTSANKES